MAELEELEQEDLEEKLLEVEGPAADSLPSVPADPVASTKSKFSHLNFSYVRYINKYCTT